MPLKPYWQNCSEEARWSHPSLLRRFVFFAGFSDEELKQLAMAGREQAASVGEILFTEGKHAHNLYFLTEGEVEILNVGTGNKESIAVSSLPAGEYCWAGRR